MKVRIVIIVGVMSLFVMGCGQFYNGYKSVKFHILTRSIPPGSRIFIAGNTDELGNWKADGVSLDPQPDGSWAKTILLPADRTIQFRVTRGHWWTQALDERGPQFGGEKQFKLVQDTIVTLKLSTWMDTDGGTTSISAREVEGGYGFGLSHGWRYHAGDDPLWSKASFNDSSWEITESHLDADYMPTNGWNGIGWFRLHLEVDSALWNKPLAISFAQAGTSEVFLDGTLIYYVGNVQQYFRDKNKIIVTRNPGAIYFGPSRHHIIAVRYALRHSEELSTDAINHGLANGFHIWIGNYEDASSFVRETEIRQVTFATILGVLAFIHLILFVFYPKFKENLFYSLSTVAIGALWFANNLTVFDVNERWTAFLDIISQILQFVTVVFGVLLAYSLTRKKFPKRSLLYVAVGLMLAMWACIDRSQIYNRLRDAYTLVAMLEVMWMIITAPRRDTVGRTVLTIGFFFFGLTIVYGILGGYINLPRVDAWNDEYIYGVTALGLAMSVFLSRRFAQTNDDLEAQLVQVRELSERTLAQERDARDKEIERRLLAGDNERKTKELEDARDLQLSLLPKNLPKLHNLDIAVRMQTATEVGGDYYDFFVSEDGTLTGVIGDATGHGLKAGNMVIAAKGLINVLVPRSSLHLDEILKTSNRAIKDMNLRMLTMCLAMIRIKSHAVEYGSAGMPPLMVYRKQTDIVEQIILKAMPLGAFYDFPYEQIETKVDEGDILLMVSDGVVELFNAKEETFGLERVEESLKEFSHNTTDEIIDCLFDRIKNWSDGTLLMDDVTAIAIKILS